MRHIILCYGGIKQNLINFSKIFCGYSWILNILLFPCTVWNLDRNVYFCSSKIRKYASLSQFSQFLLELSLIFFLTNFVHYNNCQTNVFCGLFRFFQCFTAFFSPSIKNLFATRTKYMLFSHMLPRSIEQCFYWIYFCHTVK